MMDWISFWIGFNVGASLGLVVGAFRMIHYYLYEKPRREGGGG